MEESASPSVLFTEEAERGTLWRDNSKFAAPPVNCDGARADVSRLVRAVGMQFCKSAACSLQ
jgi:hypothetical protein